jgi:MFS family permease
MNHIASQQNPLPAPAESGRIRLLLLLCSAEIASMTGYAAYPALLPVIARDWALDGTQSGTIGGAYLGGYVAAVLVLTSLTDRMDTRRIYVWSALLSGAAGFGFSLSARGVISASLFQALAGAGLAGTYMPGLRLLTDRVAGPRQSRYVAFYTATFGLGASLSLALAGAASPVAGWRGAFAMAAAGPCLAAALVYARAPADAAPGPRDPARRLFDFRPVFANREAMRYITGYAAHCWELFGLRSWTVAFLAANLESHGAPASRFAIAAGWAAAINLLGAPASILGNECAVRLGRPGYIAACMVLSAAFALTVGHCVTWHTGLLVALLTTYNLAVMSDSAALTAGLVGATDAHHRGAAMALHTFLGFGGGALAPVVFGFALDRAGGVGSAWGWGIAFTTLASGYLARGLGLAGARLVRR